MLRSDGRGLKQLRKVNVDGGRVVMQEIIEITNDLINISNHQVQYPPHLLLDVRHGDCGEAGAVTIEEHGEVNRQDGPELSS